MTEIDETTCTECVEVYGYPVPVTPEIRYAAQLVRTIYRHSCVGIPLHIYLDDWNIDIDVWEPYPDYDMFIADTVDDDGSNLGMAEDAWSAAVELCRVVSTMTLTERAMFMFLDNGGCTHGLSYGDLCD